MTINKKPAGEGNPQTGNNSTHAVNDKSFLSRIKALIKQAITGLAVWGIIPASLATWLIRRGGLKDA